MVNELTTSQLKHTPTVVILATRCDSIEECWNGDDEKFCGIPFTTSLILGWSIESFYSIVMNRIELLSYFILHFSDSFDTGDIYMRSRNIVHFGKSPQKKSGCSGYKIKFLFKEPSVQH